MADLSKLRDVKVMVIDDSNTIRRSAEIFLVQAGCQVVLAEDGFDALAKIADHQPRLIFCDIMMPRLDGYQTCSLIKKNPRFKATPVIMLSSKDGLFDRARGRMVGSDHYLTKPLPRIACCRPLPPSPCRPPRKLLSIHGEIMPVKNILVVDDSPTERYFSVDFLTKAGYHVTTAENGEEGIAKAKATKPDLILMDIVMPGLNGFQATRTLTRDEETRHIPVIVYTSRGRKPTRYGDCGGVLPTMS